MTKRCLYMLGLSLLLSAVATRADDLTAASADWPLFRGNAHQTGVAAAGLPQDLEVRWTYKTKDSVESTAAIVGNMVYVASNDKRLYALELNTGTEKWHYEAAPFKAPVSVRNGFAYVGDSDGIFHCVNAATGKGQWT